MFLGSADFNKPFVLCPEFDHEARPQDGLFGELKRMIDENMTLAECVALHISNWNFEQPGNPPHRFGTEPFQHELMHVFLGMALRAHKSLHKFLPTFYNGNMMAETFVTKGEALINSALSNLMPDPDGDTRDYYREGLNVFAMNNLYSVVRDSNRRLACAWHLAGRQRHEETAFGMRRLMHFHDLKTLSAAKDTGFDMKIPLRGTFNARGEKFKPLPVPTEAEIKAISDGLSYPLTKICRIIKETLGDDTSLAMKYAHEKEGPLIDMIGDMRLSALFAPPKRKPAPRRELEGAL